MNCLLCKFAMEERSRENPLEKKLVCIRFPPQLVNVTVQTPAGIQMGIFAMMPQVNGNMYCFEFCGKDASNETVLLAD